MKLARRCAAFCLSAALLLSTTALAADPGPSADPRQADLDQLYETLQKGHPDLFAHTSEAELLARKGEIEARLNTESDLDFALDLQTLVALVGDSHTTTSLGVSEDMHLFPFALKWFDGDWVLSTAPAGNADALGRTVTALNGVPMEQVVERFGLLVSADNPVKLRRQARQMLYVEELLVYLELAEPGADAVLTLADGGSVVLSPLTYGEMETAKLSYLADARQAVPATAYDKKQYYFSLPLDGETYYIQYNRCQEDPDLPMEDFAAQVGADLDAGDYSQVLLDLRNNGGGSDGVIWPLLDLLAPMVRSGEVKLYGLIGETTFSSAIINAVMIAELGGVLAGSPTSGSVDHFGATRGFTLEHSGIRVSCSTKWIDMETLMEAGMGYGVESLRPDVAVEATLADYLAGTDTEVAYLLAHGADHQAPDASGAPLTRGRFLMELLAAAQAAGKDVSAPDSGFRDALSFACYVPAANWAAQNGLVLGNPQGALEPVRVLTRAEAAVLLARCADYLGLKRTAQAAPALADGADLPAWAGDAAEWAVAQGLMETVDGAFCPDTPLTRGEGAALAAALSA